ncbi:MAG: hypothetical protein EOT04_01875 [Candidatus Chaera renei]|uniref:Uncharacterized protein n=1 Tax=Candidatus Chaera renei TaxID=2506947 RepID=A0A4V1J7L6_9BACT|nr:MAG: hypothetical protein EOT04_01875 [Candidatus Chaera renei]
MNDEIYNDIGLEQALRDRFGLAINVYKVIVREAPVSRSALATVFFDDKNNLYAFIAAKGQQLLDDAAKAVLRMGLEAERFMPPGGDAEYFDSIGRERFKDMFPGRTPRGEDDIRYYKKLAPYNPALVKISAVKTGEIKRFDDELGQWRVAAHFSYRKVHPLSKA